MNKSRFTFAAIALLALTAQASAGINPEALNQITFENRTGQTIEYVFVSPSDSQHWSTDILGSSRVMHNGDSLGFYIHYPNSCNNFDIMAIGEYGEAFTMWDYQICDNAEAVVPLFSSALNEDAPDFDMVEVVFENETAYDIQYLFFSPGDSAMWGIDQLDESTILYPGQSVSLLVPVGSNEVRYDVQAVDEDADSYSFYVNVDNSRERFTFAVEPGDLDW